ncbi:CapA family protein [Fulvivirgaceae bacterium BMA12]|uniref:CapA family protein n=1 Tax=Agaribacillus aureus TaxID=3051825 RepID=A0ABT8L873_9BACT|nr:CapA family protein [Fulvivirgaceae bacterium BMA12]
MQIKYCLFVCLISAILATGCKVNRVSSSRSNQSIDSTSALVPTLKQDSIFVTSKGDTLTSLDKEVAIGIKRLIKDTLSIIGVGDIMLGTNFPKPDYLPPDSGRFLLSEAQPFLRDADVTFGNLEGVILDDGGTPKHCKNPDLCYLFRSPKYMVGHLKEAGFDVVSTANNHAGDFGDIGRMSTMKVLDSVYIRHAGLQTKPYDTFMIDGMKYGFVAFAPNSGTMSIHDHEAAKKIVTHLDSISDVVIVSFHGGAEGKKYEHVTRETETFYGENRGNVYQFSHDMIDAGADVIFGHGPHVVRAIEVYNDRFICYSLGNFCTYARFNLKGPNSLAPIVKVFTKADGQFLYAKIFPFLQISPGGPQIDESKSVIQKLRELMTLDFPENRVSLDEQGYIRYVTQ